MKTATVAPHLQRTITQFMELSRWTVKESDGRTLVAQRRVSGNDWTWIFHFEDERSISQAGPPAQFARSLNEKAETTLFFDLIVPQTTVDSRHWRDYLTPEIDRVFQGKSNRRYGTVTDFLNRFAAEASDASGAKVSDLLKAHFLKAPVTPFFTSGHNALELCAQWVGRADSPRIMLVKGNAGAGKSVFALMVVRELQERFRADPTRHPAPFLVWFSKDRPALIQDLISLTLSDLGLEQSLTSGSVRFLLEQGRLVLILDGFDEVSRALAQNAEENVQELSKNINKRTFGRLLLTARPAFIDQEDIFASLKSSCEQERHEEYELAPYTDEQLHRWVVQNPPEGALSPPERHWLRVETAFKQNPAIKELCRTPVFLRMMSEVLVTRASVASLYDLLEQFCSIMWERERARRAVTLSDDQYFYAYEAISFAIDCESRIEPEEIKSALELYLEAYAQDLISGLPGTGRSLVEDLAIGPLTFKNGLFVFVHEVLAGYFLARLMARSLLSKRNVAELWNRPLKDTVWRFLPEALERIGGSDLRVDRIVSEVALPTNSGLLAWNIVRAVRLPRERWPKDLFARKQLAGIVFDDVDLRGLAFDGSELNDVRFERCNLERATFKAASIRKLRLCRCGNGAIIDDSLRVQDDSELEVTGSAGTGAELYTGVGIREVLREICEARRARVTAPSDMTEQAVVLIFSSLFKSDLRTPDYPEWRKIDKRIRGWIRTFDLPDNVTKEVGAIFVTMAREFRDSGWISPNPSRPRTFAAGAGRQRIVSDVIRSKRITGTSVELEEIVANYHKEATRLLGGSCPEVG